MRIPILHRNEVRKLDHRAITEFGVPGIVLMENAGTRCVDTLIQLGAVGPIVICCGVGNNAGDGLVIARHLELRGVSARVLFWIDPSRLQGDAAINYRIVQAAGIPIRLFSETDFSDELNAELHGADWIVDALLGTGAQGEPRPPVGRVIDLLNRHPARKLAIDIPSGLDCDTGRPARSTFCADHTCTFVAAKPGLVTPDAKPYVGEIHVHSIGAPACLLKEFGISVPERQPEP